MSTLATLRASLRNDLQDTSSTTWTDALLERAILKAVGEYQLALPLVGSADVAGVDAQRRYDLSATAGLLWVDAIEHEIGQDPIELLPFREESRGSVYLLGETLPATGDTFKVWYARAHTVDGAGSTIPAEHEELVLTGGYGHAMLMRAAATIGTINPSSWTPRQTRDLADHRLSEFNRRLAAIKATRAAPLWHPAWGGTPRSWDTV